MLPDDAVERLKKILDMLNLRNPERKIHVEHIAKTYGCSISTVYRELCKVSKKDRSFRTDKDVPRWDNKENFIDFVEIIAAIKRRSLNKKNHHISTSQAIKMAERGFTDTRTKKWVQIPEGVLTRQTCDRWLNKLGLNTKRWESVNVRFGATAPNQVWQFDISPSDAYYLDEEKGIIEDNTCRQNNKQKIRPKLMLYSVIDDFSRVEYMEYHLCYGEEVETALRFLYRAMAVKEDNSFPFQGIPGTIYLDNGPIAKANIFNQVINRLGTTVKLHETPERAKGRTAARSKGKIERSFLTCKNSFESLFQFIKPKNLIEANEKLCIHLLNIAYSKHPFWNEKRIDVWHNNLPQEGIRQICDWEQYCDLARKPHQRLVTNDRMVTLNHQQYMVDDKFRGKKVQIWRGILDEGLFVQAEDGIVYGPYQSAPIPLQFGKFHKLKSELDQRREKIIDLAQHIDMPAESVFIDTRNEEDRKRQFTITGKTADPDSPTGILCFLSPFQAKEAIFKEFGVPLGRLNQEQRQKINQLLHRTLQREKVMTEAKKIIEESKDATRNS